MEILSLFAALASLALVNGQAVFQQSAYPLSGFLQPLTYQALQNTFQQPQQQQQQLQQQQTVQQQQAAQQPALQQGLVLQQQPQYQTQPQSNQQQAAPSSSGTYQQQQQPTITGQQQQQQVTQTAQTSQQLAAYSGPSAVVNNVNADGTYSFGYQTPDGQMRAEAVQADGTTKGSYTYRTPEGQLVTINYTAGKHGFQTSPGTSITSDPSTAPATGSAPSPSLLPVSGTTASGTPYVIYSTVPQSGFQSFYPFTGVVAQPDGAEQQQAASTTGQSQGTQEQQPGQATAQAPTLRTPVAISYGSNPQAIQQLQRLLLV